MGEFSISDGDPVGFVDGTEIEGGTAKRVVDVEAGVVLYAVKIKDRVHGGGYGVAAVPIKDTNLSTTDDGEVVHESEVDADKTGVE